MDTNYLENNYLTLVGKVTSEKKFSHEIYGERFYSFDLSTPRLSGNADIIPVTVSERLINDDMMKIGTKLLIKEAEGEESNEFAKKDTITNEVVLVGYICKKPIYRQTPFGREIADILLAVNRAYNKSDYIPSIAWGRNARFCQNLEVGTEVKIVGRIQSRNYEKKYEDGTVVKKVAYEVSVGSLEVVKENEDQENEETTAQEAM